MTMPQNYLGQDPRLELVQKFITWGYEPWLAWRIVKTMDAQEENLAASLRAEDKKLLGKIDDLLKFLPTPEGQQMIEEERQLEFYEKNYDPATGLPLNAPNPEEEFKQAQRQDWTTQAKENVKERQVAERETEAQQQWAENQTGMPSYSGVTAPALAQLEGNPAMKRYYENQLMNLYNQQGMQAQREQWWQEKNKYIPSATSGLSDVGQSELGAEGLAAVSSRGQVIEEEKRRRQALPDPWMTFLSQYPFLENFRKLTPQEKGMYTGQFRPRTRYL